MSWPLYRIWLFLACALFAASSAVAQTDGSALTPQGNSAALASETDGALLLWYFRRDDCPFCERAEQWLPGLLSRNPALELRRVDVGADAAARTVFEQQMQQRGQMARAVPSFILGDQVWVGFSDTLAADIQYHVALAGGLADAGETAPGGGVDLGLFGSVDLSQMPMLAATILIAFVDGFNPCSLWVLTVLLAMILGSQSRARIAAVGFIFLLVTASIYGLFIVGLFSAMMMMDHLGWVRWLVAAFALIFGAVNLKDYFAWQRGFSFSIPERFKPGIYRRGRAVRLQESLPLMLLMTVLMATGVAIIELPCTAGFPVVWTSLLLDNDVQTTGFLALLVVYLLIYLMVEIVIVLFALATMRVGRMQAQQGRLLKLLGGCIMIMLALVLLIEPGIMASLGGSLLVMTAALLASFLLHYWYQRHKP